MALYYNNVNVSPQSQIYINSQASQKAYYNNLLVWEKTKQFYPGTTVQVKAIHRGNYGSFYVNCSINQEANINGSVVYIPVDLNGIRKLRIGCSGYTTGISSCCGIWIANSTQWADEYKQGYPYYTIGLGADSANYVRMYRARDGQSFSSVEFDVSDLSGTHYLACAIYINAPVTSCTAGVTINSVYGDY